MGSFAVRLPLAFVSRLLRDAAGVAGLLGWRAWRERDANIWIALAWLVGVILPHLIATSKTPTAALVGWPAGWILIGCAIDRGLRGDALLLGAWFGAAVASVASRTLFARQGMGYPQPPIFAGVMRDNLWIVGHGLIALVCAIALTSAMRRLNARSRATIGIFCTVLAIAASVCLRARYLRAAWLITEQNRNAPSFAEIGRFARASLPENAVILVDETTKLQDKIVMFWTDRTCYPLAEHAQEQIDAVRRAGGRAYIVSRGRCRCRACSTAPRTIARFMMRPINCRWMAHRLFFLGFTVAVALSLEGWKKSSPRKPSTARGSSGRAFPQFTIFLENRVGRLSGLLRALEENVGTINALSIEESADSALVRLVCADPDEGRAALRNGGFSFSESEVLAVELPAKSRQPLLSICTALLSAEINIHYAYPMLARPRGPAIVLYVDDPTLAAQILIRKGYVIIGESDLKV